MVDGNNLLALTAATPLEDKPCAVTGNEPPPRTHVISDRGVTREGHEGRAHPPPKKKKFRLRFLEGAWRDHCFPEPFSWFLLNADLSWRPEDHFCKLFVIEMSPERHEKSGRRPPVSWRPCAGVQPRPGVQLVTYHACQRSGTTFCSTSDHLKESHDTAVKAQGKATRTAWQSTISSGQLWLIRILQLLIARECFWGEAEREWWGAEVARCTTLCFVGSKTSFCEVTPMKMWTKQQFLASAVQVMVLGAVWQGSRISREFHCFA